MVYVCYIMYVEPFKCNYYLTQGAYVFDVYLTDVDETFSKIWQWRKNRFFSINCDSNHCLDLGNFLGYFYLLSVIYTYIIYHDIIWQKYRACQERCL